MQSSDKREEKKEVKTYALDEEVSLATTTASTASVCSYFTSFEDLKELKFFRKTFGGVGSVVKAIKENAIEFAEKEGDVFLKLTEKGEKIRKKFEY